MGLLRTLLAITVFFDHFGGTGVRSLNLGYRAVEVFYVISGFYIQLVLRNRYARTYGGDHWVWKFYLARFLKIYPVYVTCMLVTVSCCLLGLVSEPLTTWTQICHLESSRSNFAAQLFIGSTNFLIILQDVAMYLAAQGGHIGFTMDFRASDINIWQGLAIPPAWSLGLEFTFYAISPFLLNLKSHTLITIAASSLIIKFGVGQIFHLSDPFTYRFFSPRNRLLYLWSAGVPIS